MKKGSMIYGYLLEMTLDTVEEDREEDREDEVNNGDGVALDRL